MEIQDSVFGFSPDGRQLAVSSQRTFRHNKRTAIHIRLLDIDRPHIRPLSFKWCTLYCDEKFNEARRDLGLLKKPATYPRLAFASWDGCWVAGLWEKSKQALVLHDLHTHSRLASLDVSSLDASRPGLKKVIFSGNLEFAASYKHPASAILGRFKRGKQKTSDNLVTVASVKTNQTICTLEGVDFEHYWFSHLGQYVMVRKKKELKIFRLQESGHD